MIPIRIVNPLRKPDPVSRITGVFRWGLGNKDKPLPYNEFSTELSLSLAPLKRKFTSRTVRRWEKGKAIPSDEALEALTTRASPGSWQWHFAHDLKAAIYPQIYAPTGQFGKRILGRDIPLHPIYDQP
jgi:hypothetical protein